jgi:MATE family multidrug resistance protein
MNFKSILAETKILVKLGIPIAIAEMSGMFINLVTTLMLGKVGATLLAGVGAGNSVFWVLAMIGIVALSMTAPLSAAADESNDRREHKLILYAGLWVSLIFSVFLMLLLFFLCYNFHLFGHEASVEAVARPYLFTITLGLLPFLVFIHLVNFVDGMSLTRVGMMLGLGSVFINLPINWLLIEGKWGFPALGLVGTGVSFIVSLVVQMLLVGIYIWKNPRFSVIHAALVSREEIRQKVFDYMKTSLPSGLQTVIEYFAYSLGAVWIGWIGKTPLAGHQVAMQLASTTFVVLLAIGQAGSIRIGQAIGGNDRENLKIVGASSMIFSVALVLMPALVFLFFSDKLAAFFTTDVLVQPIAANLIFIGGIFQVADALQSVSIALLRGMEDTRLPSVISFVAYWLLGMPVGYFCAFVLNWGAQGVWLGFLIALFTQGIWFAWRFFKLASKNIEI